MRETFMQEIIIKYPSEVLNEEGLTFVDREVTTGNRRLDIVLKDRMGRMILLEAQIGNLDTNHIDRHIDFVEGFLSKHPDVDIRVMYVAFAIDPLRKKFLERRAYEFKEISEYRFKQIAEKYNLMEQIEIPETELIDEGKPYAPSFQYDSAEIIKKPSKIFQHPQNVSSRWKSYALKQVELWLRKVINSFPFEKPIEVKEIALSSRDVAKITDRGNADGVRYLLWKLHYEGYIDFPDNLHFVVLKK